MNFFDMIEKNRTNLNKDENKLLKYIIEHASEVKDMTIKDLSKLTFTSPAGIVRFCKKLGFRGYSELKNSLYLTAVNVSIKPDKKFSGTIFDDIEKTKDLLNFQLIEEILELIYKAHRIDFYGEGSSKMVCIEMARRFRSINKISYSYDDTSIMYASAGTLTAHDLVFAVSMTGETKQIIKAVNIAKSKKATIVSLTNLSNNTLSNIADKSLFVFSNKYVINDDIEITSRVPALVLMEYIFYNYLRKYVKDK
ncbi:MULTISPECIES: MurR/RpiR family transcriptional regulator [Thermoanaerobacter]|uniref:DNA-binding MurR/RpiR family transcriptional regulator n=1 Tax=Thermoanaerobacter pentosaceus TaxID=694059 RepID=A0ABT9M763_9THEO|nr:MULTISPECIES: MurR/RpiR family transcriptional regulator [Thermoanaerobacter]MDP9751979.1 DNA-binding MurR/RpiR family transcriptional regulator [Thermoanaerobacter pentosaceus]